MTTDREKTANVVNERIAFHMKAQGSVLNPMVIESIIAEQNEVIIGLLEQILEQLKGGIKDI